MNHSPVSIPSGCYDSAKLEKALSAAVKETSHGDRQKIIGDALEKASIKPEPAAGSVTEPLSEK